MDSVAFPWYEGVKEVDYLVQFCCIYSKDQASREMSKRRSLGSGIREPTDKADICLAAGICPSEVELESMPWPS